jgi:hypothetical protein
VGESSRLETAIEVTGLRPGHFYNVRVIAVGSNNFQAGSKIIRLRTLGRDGRPLANTLTLSSAEEQDSASEEETAGGKNPAVGVQATALPEASQAMTREPSASYASQRRNTGGRRHSPSTAGADQAAREHAISNLPEESMHQLTEKFESIRRETEEIATQTTKDNEDYQTQLDAFMRERDEKKQALKDKEEASERLKKEVNYYERLNRQAQNRKSQKEKILKDKQSEQAKMQEDMIRWKKEIQDMRIERESWRKEQEAIKRNKEDEAEKLRQSIQASQLSQEALDEEIHAKGIQIKHLEDERKKLPGSEDDEESRSRDARDQQLEFEWQGTERECLSKLNATSQEYADIKTSVTQRQNQLAALQANPALHQANSNSSGVDFEPTGVQNRLKPRSTRNRKSRTNTISSPISAFPITDSAFPSAAAYNNLHMTSPTFAPGPYMDMRNHTAMVPLSEQMHGMSEDDIRSLTAGAPLSPTATQLLPAGIFADDDMASDGEDDHRFLAQPFEDPQSPNSSSRSPSIFSSPQNSSQNLALYGVSGHDYADIDRRSMNSPRTNFRVLGSSVSEHPAGSHPNKLLELFSRTRGKTMQEDGPSLGSLKQGQSQSFPRSTEEPETMTTKQRRISFTSGWPSFLRGSPAAESASQGNGPAPARNVGARSRRGFNMFSNSLDDPNIRSDRDPASPRPLSIASSDLPRPSTDSAPFGWGPPQETQLNRASPLATNWGVHHTTQTWSRDPSRRPSIQHGSTTALTSGIADDDDDFLPPSDPFANQFNSAASVGVIGTRPASSHKPVTPKLNPAAPAFSFTFGRSKSEKDHHKGTHRGKTDEPVIAPEDDQENPYASSTSISRQSRDTQSIHTQNSMAESYESLDRVSSNPVSDKAPLSSASTKDKETSSFKGLFRKASSSKFSVGSLRNKEGFFGGKKAGSSTASDRNASTERDGSFDEFGSDTLPQGAESVTSSPMIGSINSGESKGKDRDKEGMWSRFSRKKGKTSMDVDRSETEYTGTEDEG